MSVEILVPLDGSAAAEHALAPAVALAKRANGRLHLCRVCPPFRQPERPEGPQPRRCPRRECVRALVYMRMLRERLAASFGVGAHISIRYGQPAESILRVARLVGAELIVLSTHRRRRAGSGWIGPTADQVVHRADCPVLLLPAGRGLVDWHAGTYQRILLPVENAAGVGAVLAGTPVVPPGPHVTCGLLQVAPEYTDHAADGVELAQCGWPYCVGEIVQALAASLEERGQRTLALSAEGEPPLEAIIRAARAFDAELIVLGLPAKRDLKTAWLGPLAEQLLLMTPLPLLLHRPVALAS